MLSRGLTTFSEIVDRPGSPSRSDCHAWSASPNIEIFRTVLGVDSMAPGFHRVAVRPHLGKLIGVAGGMPHPKGEVEVRMEPRGAGFEVTVSLPEGVTGEFAWRGTRRELSAGVNRFAVAG
jgi:alpha-L-rhamnosidase